MTQSNGSTKMKVPMAGRPRREMERKRVKHRKQQLTDDELTVLDDLWLEFGITSKSKRDKLIRFSAIDPIFADPEAVREGLELLRDAFARVGGPSSIYDVAEMVTLQPRLLSNYDPESLATKMHGIVQSFDRIDHAVRIVRREPQVLFLRSESVGVRLQQLQEVIPYADAKSIVFKHPRLLSVRPLETVAPKLQELYDTLGAYGITEKEVQKLVEQHPSVLLLKASERMEKRLRYVESWVPGSVRHYTSALALILKVSEKRLRRVGFMRQCYPDSRWTLSTLLNRSEQTFDNAYPGFAQWLSGKGCVGVDSGVHLPGPSDEGTSTRTLSASEPTDDEDDSNDDMLSSDPAKEDEPMQLLHSSKTSSAITPAEFEESRPP